MVKDLDANQSGGNDKRGGSCPDFFGVGNEKCGVSPRNYETDNKNTADIEDQDTPEGPLDCNWNVPPRILSLANGDTDQFGPHVGEECIDKSCPETKEDGEAMSVGDLFVKVFTHWTMRGIPVTETTVGKKGESRMSR